MSIVFFLPLPACLPSTSYHRHSIYCLLYRQLTHTHVFHPLLFPSIFHQAFVHVSTAYCTVKKINIEEKVYREPISPEKVLEMAE